MSVIRRISLLAAFIFSDPLSVLFSSTSSPTEQPASPKIMQPQCRKRNSQRFGDMLSLGAELQKQPDFVDVLQGWHMLGPTSHATMRRNGIAEQVKILLHPKLFPRMWGEPVPEVRPRQTFDRPPPPHQSIMTLRSDAAQAIRLARCMGGLMLPRHASRAWLCLRQCRDSAQPMNGIDRFQAELRSVVSGVH